MSERVNNNSNEYYIESNSFNTELSDLEIRHIKQETKYRPDYAQLLEKHIKDSNSFYSFAGLIKASESTLYLWIKKFPEFAAIKEKYKKKKASLYA